MSPSPLEHLRHVLDEADCLAGMTARLTREQFLQDETAKRAVARSLEVIGEAIKAAPEELRARHPGVEWRMIARMRNRIVHHHFGIDYELVGEAAETNVPRLREQVSEIPRREAGSHS
jgi:uncharacterized protein with HEPN domain